MFAMHWPRSVWIDEEGVRLMLADQEPDLALLLLEGYGIERERWTLP